MMPMLRYRSRGVVRAITQSLRRFPVTASEKMSRRWCAGPDKAPFPLPAVMRERLVGVRHPMCVFALFDRDAAIARGIEQLARQPLFHRVLRARPRAGNQPADRQCLAALRANLDRHLIGGAANTARANLDRRTHIAQRVVEDADRILTAAPLNAVKRAIDDPLGDRLLALVHQTIHELGQHDVTEFRIRLNLAFDRGPAARHRFASLSRPLGAVFRPALTAILDALG